MDFPTSELLDQDACFAKLVQRLHTEGPTYPHCHRADRMRMHRSHRSLVRDYRCGRRRRVYNDFTGTSLHGVQRRPGQLDQIARGSAQGAPLAASAGARVRLLGVAHTAAPAARPGVTERRPDAARGRGAEGRLGLQVRGGNVHAANRPRRPTAAAGEHRAQPRQLAIRPRTFCGAVGRERGKIRLRVARRYDRATRQRVVREASWPLATANTDKWRGYSGLTAKHRHHASNTSNEFGARSDRSRTRPTSTWSGAVSPYPG